MSVSDPLLKDLKGWTRKLTETDAEITDDNPELLCLCESLEKCFQNGIVTRMNSMAFLKSPDAWHWLEEFGQRHKRLLFSFSSAVESVSNNPKVGMPLGKMRLLIRTCLTKKCLHMPVQLLVRSAGMAVDYYAPKSILGDEILGEIFLSALLQIGKLSFKLNLKNARFLDDTWQLPDSQFYELVPCKTLGVSVCFVKEKALIVNVQENSVAAEDNKVQIGDILDEINGEVLTGNSKGKLNKIIKKSSGLPITLHIIKHHFYKTGHLYGPIVPLLKLCNVERVRKLLKSPAPNKVAETPNEIDMLSQSIKSGYHVKYCGSMSTGMEGDVKQIEGAIWKLINSEDAKIIPVRFECMEIGIKVTQDSDEAVILNQSYMEISSCGRTQKYPNYFAFIAGNTNCSVATKFEAFIFQHCKETEVQIMLQSLAQGFHRTHFAV